MALIDDSVKEVIDSNKAKTYEEEKKMRKELGDFIQTCCKFHLQELHSEFKRMVRNKI
tara:strand:- start:374 stop:547 length:174 start_codon:yes stop_codon:yes gene_type:complete